MVCHTHKQFHLKFLYTNTPARSRINGDRAVVANACSVAGFTSSIDFPSGNNIQTWTAYVTVDGKPNPTYKADVKTGTTDYTCGHSGADGVLSACFTGAGVKIAASRWSIWGRRA